MRSILLLALLLVIPVPASADWLQAGYDAARTSHTPEPGPHWNDVALQVQLPVIDPSNAFLRVTAPIILGDTIFAAVQDFPTFDQQVGACGTTSVRTTLWAQPVDGGAAQIVDALAGPKCTPSWVVSDGSHVFLVAGQEIRAYNSTTRLEEWQSTNRLDTQVVEEAPRVPPTAGDDALPLAAHPDCASPVVWSGLLLLGCIWVGPVAASAQAYVVGFNTTAGGDPVVGPLVYDGQGDRITKDVPERKLPSDLFSDTGLAGKAVGLAVADGTAFLVSQSHDTFYTTDPSTVDRYSSRWSRIWALDVDAHEDGSIETMWSARLDTSLSVSGQEDIPDAAPPMILGDVVMAKAGLLYAFSRNAPEVSRSPQLRETHYDGDPGAGCTAAGIDLFCAFNRILYRLTPDFAIAWRSELPIGERWAAGHLVGAGGTIFGITEAEYPSATSPPLSGSKVVAMDAETGELLWSHSLSPRGATGKLAVSGEIAVGLQMDGALTVLGRTAASPALHVDPSTRYPADGSLVSVNLAASGGLREPAAFMADWGDGVISVWQAEPTFTHRYTTKEDHEARFFVRNGANQTASMPLTFFVGQKDPSINIWNSPFSAAYQETSFFVLGLVATGLIAIFGFARAGRKRRRLDVELRTLESEYKRLADDPNACDHMLSETKARARSLFLQKRLEEAHTSFIERRVDELRQGLRVSAIDEKLKFLPYGMVQHLRRLLQDGRVDAWERSHFLDALDREKELNKAQRTEVRRLVDSWFTRDSAR